MSVLEGKKDALIGIVILFFSVGLILLIPSQIPSSDSTSTLPSFVYPLAILSLMSILSVMLVIRGYYTIKNHKNIDESNSNRDKTSLGDLSLFIITPFFIILTSNIIGFTFAAMISLFCMLWILGNKQFYRMLVISVLLPLSVDLILRFSLNVFLPLGFWNNIFNF